MSLKHRHFRKYMINTSMAILFYFIYLFFFFFLAYQDCYHPSTKYRDDNDAQNLMSQGFQKERFILSLKTSSVDTKTL